MSSTAESSSVLQIATAASRTSGTVDAVEMNRSERIGFWMYVAMGSSCVGVIVAAATSAIVS